jgi:hypothetical protein
MNCGHTADRQLIIDSHGPPGSAGVSPAQLLRYKHRSPITTHTAFASWLIRESWHSQCRAGETPAFPGEHGRPPVTDFQSSAAGGMDALCLVMQRRGFHYAPDIIATKKSVQIYNTNMQDNEYKTRAKFGVRQLCCRLAYVL